MKPCLLNTCAKKAIACGLCSAHYTQMKRRSFTIEEYVEWKSEQDKRSPFCAFDNCARKRFGQKDYCNTHYYQSKRGNGLYEIVPRSKDIVHSKNPSECIITECFIKPAAKGLCSSHYNQSRKYGLDAVLLFNTTNKCEACGTTQNLCVDHDHKCCPGKYSCGKCVRGILCSDCNQALGRLKDSVLRIDQIKNYIEGKLNSAN